MLYLIVRPVARFVLRFYYRNIDLSGLEHIPADAAVILASNHPTAFIEPCLLACFQPRTLWFLARGDLFKTRLARWGLAAVNILPVFRLQDGGFKKLRNNYGTFDACYRALSDRRALMILAEGRCIHGKHLLPLRKGTARLALGALSRDVTLPEVYIVPVGVNFTHAERVRGTVMIRCGEPIRASAYLEEYRSSEATAIKQLTSHLRARLSPLVVQVPPDRVTAAEAHLATDRDRHAAHRRYGINHDGNQLDRELAMAAAPDERALPYRARLRQNGLEHRPTRQKLNWRLLAGLALLLQLPYLPLWLLAEYLAVAKPKTIEFYSPVRFATLAGGTLLLFPLGLLLLPWPGKIWLLLTLLTVRWSIRQWEDLAEWRRYRRWQQLVPEERRTLENMEDAVS